MSTLSRSQRLTLRRNLNTVAQKNIALINRHTKKQLFRVVKRNDSGLIIGGLGLLAFSFIIQNSVQFFNRSPTPEQTSDTTAETTEAKANTQTASNQRESQKNKKTESTTSTSKGSFFGELFSSSWFARNFYDGGFEEKMTKREAALILGVILYTIVQYYSIEIKLSLLSYLPIGSNV
jgi:hypothetical protein